jgi:hypothetical protein
MESEGSQPAGYRSRIVGETGHGDSQVVVRLRTRCEPGGRRRPGPAKAGGGGYRCATRTQRGLCTLHLLCRLRNLHSSIFSITTFGFLRLCFHLLLIVSSARLSQVHGESSATSQSALHSQTGTSFEASEEAPQEAASCVRLFVEMSAQPTLIFEFLIFIKPFVVQRYYRKHGTNIKRSDKSTYTQAVTGNV